jgi:hypothetical protein
MTRPTHATGNNLDPFAGASSVHAGSLHGTRERVLLSELDDSLGHAPVRQVTAIEIDPDGGRDQNNASTLSILCLHNRFQTRLPLPSVQHHFVDVATISVSCRQELKLWNVPNGTVRRQCIFC